MNFFEYKDFNDFINKMGFTIDQGIAFLDNKLKKLEREIDDNKYRVHSNM